MTVGQQGFDHSSGNVGTGVEIDQGLRAQYLRVYNLLLGGILLTAATAVATFATGFTDMLYGKGGATLLGLVFMFAPIAYVVIMNMKAARMSATKLRFWYWATAATFGVSLSLYGLIYTPGSIVGAFVATVAGFAGLSIYGHTTTRDLAGIGAFMSMAVWGLIAAMIANAFMGSAPFDYLISCAAIVIFAVLTAWDTQRIRRDYDLAHGDDELSRLAVLGALSLYLDFVNIFLHVLRLWGVKIPGQD
jgi:FtsH-binding integral membrane protein